MSVHMHSNVVFMVSSYKSIELEKNISSGKDLHRYEVNDW